MARFVGDFLRLRRDLKLAWRAYVGMDSLRLVTDEREAALSRANNVLQLFCREDVALDARGDVVGHVIVKVGAAWNDATRGTDAAAQSQCGGPFQSLFL